MPSLSTKERKAKFKTDDLILRKEFSLPSGARLSYQAMLILNTTHWITHNSSEYNSDWIQHKLFGNKSKQTVNFSNIPKIPFFITFKEIYNSRKI